MKDYHRPIFHFQPPSDWMNDPKLFYWKKKIHLFFQYSPGNNWKLRHWGHAVSKDMLHWKLLPIALTPTQGESDKDGCYTGSIVADPLNQRGKFHILYTGV